MKLDFLIKQGQNIIMKKILLLISAAVVHTINVSAQSDSIKTTTIGNQVWMIDNLAASQFRNGDGIKQAKTFADWKRAGEKSEPAWCYYANNTTYGSQLGKLYNWYAVNDIRGLAPKGWHIATDEEWAKLIDESDGQQQAGTKLKNNGGWADDGNGNNESGFSALPGGSRGFMDDFQDGFVNIGYTTIFWTTTASADTGAWAITLRSSNSSAIKNGRDKGEGLSVR